ncbi:MAG: hypothetical protein J7L15_08945 [Clostridiales bacterium]|nr:hypothetical protein [Clostridiales bacterium]
MSGFQSKEASWVKGYIVKGAQFMFIPYTSLVEMVAKNQHPFVKALPAGHKLAIMNNSPIRIEATYALRYYEGKCDDRNNFILDRGDIKIIPHQLEKPKDLIEKEDEINEEKKQEEIKKREMDLGNGWKIVE